MSYFAADPYSFNQSKRFKPDKEIYIERDAKQLRRFLGLSLSSIRTHSELYIGREKYLFRYLLAMKFWENALKSQLKQNSSNLATLVSIFAIEGAITGYSIIDNQTRWRSFLIECLSRDEKIELLSRYTFGTPKTTGQGTLRRKHLMYRAAAKHPIHGPYSRQYCSTATNPICACRDWLNQASDAKIDRYLSQLGTLLYRMRNAICHEGTYIAFTSTPFFVEDLGMVLPMVSDTFSFQRGEVFTSYETEISTKDFIEILKSGARRLYKRGSILTARPEVPLLKRL